MLGPYTNLEWRTAITEQSIIAEIRKVCGIAQKAVAVSKQIRANSETPVSGQYERQISALADSMVCGAAWRLVFGQPHSICLKFHLAVRQPLPVRPPAVSVAAEVTAMDGLGS